MSFLATMKSRYTTKKYNADKKLTDLQLNELKEILQLSPSSINGQPWHFHFVRDQKVKSQLAEASMFNAEKILNCDTLVVFSAIAEPKVFEKQITANLPEGAVGYYHAHLKDLPKHVLQTWFDKQVYISLGVFLAACGAMNIDATPMEGIEPDKYNAILGMDGYNALVSVAIGFRDENDTNQPSIKSKSRLKLNEVVTSIG